MQYITLLEWINCVMDQSIEVWQRKEKLVRTKQIELLAGNLDRASTAFVTVGIATPLIAFFYKSSADPANGVGTILAITYVALFVAVSLHLAARTVLKRLEP